ncbi:MAG: tyrosine--tRNA ligase [Pseudomonadota bacterium]
MTATQDFTSKSPFLVELMARGFLHQATNLSSLDQLLTKQKITAYIGFDATANSLHVGSLMMIMLLRLLQKHGHQPLIIIGGATTKIGDPSGKDQARKMLTDDDINHNIAGIKAVFAKYLNFDNSSANPALLVNNADWFKDIGYIEFLRDYGPAFSVNRMLTMDSVKTRLDREQNLSFLEFNYMLLQAVDFVELNKRYKCRLQLGGSDQWGNIVSGVELNRRQGGLPEVFGLTSPLITTASGQKMGKTASGAVWLSEDKLPPYDYWQFWRNVEDADVIRFLKLFTDMPLGDIDQLSSLKGNELNDAKKILATSATTLCYNATIAAEAQDTAEATFEAGLTTKTLPTINITQQQLQQLPLAKLLAEIKIVCSNSEAKKLIKGGGVKINDRSITQEQQHLEQNNFSEQGCKLSIGKKRHYSLKIIT